MDARKFVPETLRVEAGATVTFDNKSSEAHTVTAIEDEIPEGAEYFASGGLGSEDDARENIADGLIQPGESYDVTLDTPGTYSYVCLPHEQSGMTGKIIVE